MTAEHATFEREDAVVRVSRQIEDHLRARLGTRLGSIEVIIHSEGIVLRGHSPTYYVKQLAQHAVREVSCRAVLANEIEVAPWELMDPCPFDRDGLYQHSVG